MKSIFGSKIKRNHCTAAVIADYFEALQYAVMLVSENIDALKITPENFDINYIIDEVMYFQLRDNLGKKEIELARKVFESVFLHSNVLYEEKELDDIADWDNDDYDSVIVKHFDLGL